MKSATVHWYDALRTRELVDKVACIVDDPRDFWTPRGTPRAFLDPSQDPQAFVGAGATIFVSATFFTTALAT